MQTLSFGRQYGLWLILAPLLSDLPVVLIVLVILGRAGDSLLSLISIVGGGFIFYIAWGVWGQLQAGGINLDLDDAESSQQYPDIVLGLRRTMIINVMSPGPWLFWGTVIGPLFIEAWDDSPTNGLTLVVGFYTVFLIVLAAGVLLFHQARRMGEQVVNRLMWLGMAILIVFGTLLWWQGLNALL
jgi:threonine/homoserine/homoserine lactone efflux protein